MLFNENDLPGQDNHYNQIRAELNRLLVPVDVEDLDYQKSRLITSNGPLWTNRTMLHQLASEHKEPGRKPFSFPMAFVAHFQKKVHVRCPKIWSKAAQIAGEPVLDVARGTDQKWPKISKVEFLTISGCDGVLNTDLDFSHATYPKKGNNLQTHFAFGLNGSIWAVKSSVGKWRDMTGLISLCHEDKVVEHLIGSAVPGVPAIHGFGRSHVPWSSEQKLILVEQFFPMDLDQVLKQVSVTSSQVAQLTFDLLKTLQAAHDQNIIHGDIHPNNIMFEANGTMPYLIDWGQSLTADGECDRLTDCMASFLACFRQGHKVSTMTRNGHRHYQLWEIDDIEAVLYVSLLATGLCPWAHVEEPERSLELKEKFWSRILSDDQWDPSEMPFTGFRDIARHAAKLVDRRPNEINYIDYPAFDKFRVSS